MRIPSAFAFSCSLVGLSILGTVGACVGDNPATTSTLDAGGTDSSSPIDSGGDTSTADGALPDAGPPPSTGTHKFVKSYSKLYATATMAAYGEDLFAAGQGATALDIDGKPLPAATAAVMVRLDTTGKASWAASFAGTGGNLSVQPGAVAVNAAGAYMTGVFDTSTLAIGTDTLARTATNRAGYVASVALADGSAQWARSIQTTAATYAMSCKGIAATAAGIAVGCTMDQPAVKIGTMAGSVDYTAGVAGGANDFVVVMFDTAGAVKWANFFTGSGEDKLTALAADPSGDIIVVGNVASATLADKLTSASLVKPGAAGTPVPFVARLGAANGQLSWSKFLGAGGASALGVAVSADGKSIAVTGTVTASNDFGIGALAPVGASNKGDAFVVVLDASTRTPKWQSQVGGSGDKGSEDGRGVAFDSFNQLVLVGLNRSTDTKVGATAVPSPPQPVDTGWGSFAVKYDPTGKVLWTKGFASQNVSDAIGIESVAFTSTGEIRAGGGLQGTAPLDGTNNTTADVAYQIVLWGWNP